MSLKCRSVSRENISAEYWAVNENDSSLNLKEDEFLCFSLGVDIFASALMHIFNCSI